MAVVIPTLNAERPLGRLLDQLGNVPDRVVVSDGGSEDGTLRIALRSNAVVALGSSGRGQQLRRGAEFALQRMGDDTWLLALHADTVLPDDWEKLVRDHARGHPGRAAHFAYGLKGSAMERTVLKGFVRLREVAWGLPYGDQGLLVPRDVYKGVGGYHDMVLFEDVDIVTRLKRAHGRLRRIRGEVETDISAYRRDGLWRRGWRNLRLLSAYRHGEDVEVLAERYRGST